MATGRRVTLTKGQLQEQAGSDLLALLVEYCADGELSLGEVDALKGWLELNAEAAAEVPAVGWLAEIVTDVLADGRITREERQDLLVAIERVLPKNERDVAQRNRARAAEHDVAEEPPIVMIARPARSDAATERQIQFILSLGGEPTPGLSKRDASVMIDRLLANNERPSNRQMMVLRFWNRLELAVDGKRAIFAWMDEWYREDGDRRRAWELFKEENGDDGGQSDPSRVEVGIGEEYLRRVKGRGRAKASGGCAVLVLIGAGLIGASLAFA